MKEMVFEKKFISFNFQSIFSAGLSWSLRMVAEKKCGNLSINYQHFKHLYYHRSKEKASMMWKFSVQNSLAFHR